VFTGRLTTTGRGYVIAVAAAILLVLSFGDLFPESLELAADLAIPGFIGGFALLFMIDHLRIVLATSLIQAGSIPAASRGLWTTWTVRRWRSASLYVNSDQALHVVLST